VAPAPERRAPCASLAVDINHEVNKRRTLPFALTEPVLFSQNQPCDGERGSAMDEEKPRKRRTTKFTRSARNKRIVERLREGFGYDEIAREEKLTERRVRQIVNEALEGREALESAIHAHLQLDRLGQAMRVAGEALARRRPGGRAVHQVARKARPLSVARARGRPASAKVTHPCFCRRSSLGSETRFSTSASGRRPHGRAEAPDRA
jgi:hypothetical protein